MSTPFADAFVEVALILVLAVVLQTGALLLRQPALVAYLVLGIIVGPAGANLLHSHAQVELLAELGVALLLFVVGLKLDLHLLRALGRAALGAGALQVALTALLAGLLARAFGMNGLAPMYLGLAMSFSSTIVVVKLLSDKREIDALHGRLSLGVLIVQDLVVVLAMIALPALGAQAGTSGGAALAIDAARTAGLGIGLVTVLVLMARYLLPPLMHKLARSQELLVLFAIAWAVALAAASGALGFNREMGAFLAGVALASTAYREAIASRLVSLRDFLLVFFFIVLGARLDLSSIHDHLGLALALTVLVLFVKPLLVAAPLGLLGYRKRTGFLAAGSLAQVSEFSLLLVSLGVSEGHLDVSVVSVVALVALLTIPISSYGILYADPVYRRLAPLLGFLERRTGPTMEDRAASSSAGGPPEIILFGLGRLGGTVAGLLVSRGRRLLAIDFDPNAIARARSEGVSVVYGDAEDPELLSHLPIDGARWVVSALPGRRQNLAVLAATRGRNVHEGLVAVTAHSQDEAAELGQAGADLILHPYTDAALHAADALTSALADLPLTRGDSRPGTPSGEAPWPLSLRELRIPLGSALAGVTIGDTPLRSALGVTILAVSRQGISYFDPEPAFRLLPGDRVVLAGDDVSLDAADALLSEVDVGRPRSANEAFLWAWLRVEPDSPWVGQSLAELDFRRRFGASILGIRRAGTDLLSPGPEERLKAGDRLVIAGQAAAVAALRSE